MYITVLWIYTSVTIVTLNINKVQHVFLNYGGGGHYVGSIHFFYSAAFETY